MEDTQNNQPQGVQITADAPITRSASPSISALISNSSTDEEVVEVNLVSFAQQVKLISNDPVSRLCITLSVSFFDRLPEMQTVQVLASQPIKLLLEFILGSCAVSKLYGLDSNASILFLGDDRYIKLSSTEASSWFDCGTLSFNRPFLAIHNGCCEHWLILLNVFVLDKEVLNTSSSYPKWIAPDGFSQPTHLKHRKCRLCETFRATFLLFHCKLAAEDPLFVCDRCLECFLPGILAKQARDQGLRAMSAQGKDSITSQPMYNLTLEQKDIWGPIQILPLV